MSTLIPSPNLDLRDEAQLAAEAIARVSGGLNLAQIDGRIEMLRQLRDRVAAGAVPPPACPELTNANPSSPHTVLLEAQGWLLAQIARRINRVPERDLIEFARLFQIELREAEAALTTLTFHVAAPPATNVTIPAGTQVSTNDRSIVFETLAQIVIPSGQLEGSVSAECTRAGIVQLAPDTLTRSLDVVAFVSSVTNDSAIDGGTEAETVEEALVRMRHRQRRGERLVTSADIEEAILEDALAGNGIVRAFPFVRAGDFASDHAGHTTVVVMTRTGLPVDDAVRRRINALLETLVGNQFVYIIDPVYQEFDVTADVRLSGSAPQTATLAAVERNLRAFYAPDKSNFGRDILRAEVIAIIEATGGVDRIVASSPTGAILAQPLADVRLQPWVLPRLHDVTLNAV